jgi:serine/threonine protein kinase
VSLEYIHGKSILHRDIKPENLVFDDKGYLRVTDFGIARIWNPENSKETSGTPGYMAPEVMCRQNHGVAVDYFAVGIIGYECMMGRVRSFYLQGNLATLHRKDT